MLVSNIYCCEDDCIRVADVFLADAACYLQSDKEQA